MGIVKWIMENKTMEKTNTKVVSEEEFEKFIESVFNYDPKPITIDDLKEVKENEKTNVS